MPRDDQTDCCRSAYTVPRFPGAPTLPDPRALMSPQQQSAPGRNPMTQLTTPQWPRRQALLGGLAATAGFARQATATTTDYETALYDQARQEGEVTWYTAQILGETAQRVVTAFNATWPGIKVNLLRASG